MERKIFSAETRAKSASPLKDSCQPEYKKRNMHQKPGQPHAGGQSSSIIRNFWGDIVLQNIPKEKKNKSDLLNKLQIQNIFSALKFILSEPMPTDKPIHSSSTNVLDTPWACGIFFSVYVGSIQKCIALETVDWTALPLHFLESLFPILL